MQKKRVDQKAFDSNFTAQSMDIGPGHKKQQQTEKLYKKGKSTTNPYEGKEFLKRTGAQLPPLAKKKSKKKYG